MTPQNEMAAVTAAVMEMDKNHENPASERSGVSDTFMANSDVTAVMSAIEQVKAVRTRSKRISWLRCESSLLQIDKERGKRRK